MWFYTPVDKSRSYNVDMITKVTMYIWLNPRERKIKRIISSDWLPERARWSGFPVLAPKKKYKSFCHIINRLFTTIEINLYSVFMTSSSFSVKKQKTKNNLANTQKTQTTTTQKQFGQYPVILTTGLVNNTYFPSALSHGGAWKNFIQNIYTADLTPLTEGNDSPLCVMNASIISIGAVQQVRLFFGYSGPGWVVCRSKRAIRAIHKIWHYDIKHYREHFDFALQCFAIGSKGDDITREDSQHNFTTLSRHWFEWLEYCSNMATKGCAKNRRYESSRVTSPQETPATALANQKWATVTCFPRARQLLYLHSRWYLIGSFRWHRLGIGQPHPETLFFPLPL